MWPPKDSSPAPRTGAPRAHSGTDSLGILNDQVQVIARPLTQLARLAHSALAQPLISLDLNSAVTVIPTALASAVAVSAGVRWVMNAARASSAAMYPTAPHHHCLSNSGLIPASITNVYIMQRPSPNPLLMLALLLMMILGIMALLSDDVFANSLRF